MSLVKRALALSTSLSDWRLPLACPTCFMVVCFRLQPTDEQPSLLLEDLRDNHPDFWDSCITFVTAPRSEDDLPGLRAQLRKNVSACSYRAEHNTFIRSNFTDVVHTLVEALYMALVACLSRGRHSAMNRSKAPKGFGTRHGRWPETAEKLFPFGEQQCIDMHVFWTSLRFSTGPFALLTCNLEVARARVLPHLSEGTVRARLLYILAQMLHVDVVTVPDGWEGEPPLHPGSDAAFPLALPKERHALLELSMDFLQILHSGLDSRAYEHLVFFAGYELAMYNALVAASHAVDPSRPTFSTLAHFADLMHIKLKLPASVLPSHITSARAQEPMKSELAAGTLRHLVRLTKYRGCSSPGCATTVHDNGGKPLSTCAKCKTVRYCCRDCQQRDWKTGPYKHKVICPMLCRLLADASQGMTSQQFEETFDRELDEEDRLTIYQWSTTSRLLLSEQSSRILDHNMQAMNDFRERLLLQPEEIQDQVLDLIKDLRSSGNTVAMLGVLQRFTGGAMIFNPERLKELEDEYLEKLHKEKMESA